jgi:hypothetical protein
MKSIDVETKEDLEQYAETIKELTKRVSYPLDGQTNIDVLNVGVALIASALLQWAPEHWEKIMEELVTTLRRNLKHVNDGSLIVGPMQ